MKKRILPALTVGVGLLVITGCQSGQPQPSPTATNATVQAPQSTETPISSSTGTVTSSPTRTSSATSQVGAAASDWPSGWTQEQDDTVTKTVTEYIKAFNARTWDEPAAAFIDRAAPYMTPQYLEKVRSNPPRDTQPSRIDEVNQKKKTTAEDVKAAGFDYTKYSEGTLYWSAKYLYAAYAGDKKLPETRNVYQVTVKNIDGKWLVDESSPL